MNVLKLLIGGILYVVYFGMKIQNMSRKNIDILCEFQMKAWDFLNLFKTRKVKEVKDVKDVETYKPLYSHAAPGTVCGRFGCQICPNYNRCK